MCVFGKMRDDTFISVMHMSIPAFDAIAPAGTRALRISQVCEYDTHRNAEKMFFWKVLKFF